MDTLSLAQLSTEVLTRTAHEMIAILTTPAMHRSITAHNSMVDKKYFGSDVLRAHLCDVIDWARFVSSQSETITKKR